MFGTMGIKALVLLPFVVVALASGIGARQPVAGQAIAFVNVSVVPMDRDRVMPAQTVIVADGRLVAIGAAATVTVPANAQTIDGRGRYLMPGLAEMHAHIPGGQATDEAIERVLFLYVANGVTTARGMLGAPRHLALRARARRGEILSPTIYTSGPSLNGNSVPTAEAATRAVEEQKAAGYDFLKIHPGITRDVFETLASTARRVGIGYAGHVPLDLGLERALELRFLTIDHLDGYVEAMVPPSAPKKPTDSQWFGVNLVAFADEARIGSLVTATGEAGTWMVPTQVLFEHGQGNDAPDEMAKWAEMRYVAAEQLAQWVEGKRKFLASPEGAADNRARFIAIRRQLIRALHDGGVGMLLGSDAPQVWNVPGFATHRELKAMVASGLTPYQALAMGTRNVAAFFGTLGATGTVEVGKRADLVLVEGNPLQDIASTGRIAGVVAGGRWLGRDELDRRLAGYALR